MKGLHIDIVGEGREVVLLHGWAMHGGVWRDLAQRLCGRARLHLIDLPGHGFSAACEDYALDALAQRVLAAAPPRAVWLGWSLGGMLAVRIAALVPERVERLILIASSPCFAQRPDWRAAVEPAVLRAFAAQLQSDPAGTVQRFVALQAVGADDARSQVKRLRQILAQRPVPDVAALRAGMDILRDADMRSEYARLTLPIRLVYGGRDTLVPPAAARWAAQALPGAELHLVDEAAHAPFLSHAEKVAGIVGDFIGK